VRALAVTVGLALTLAGPLACKPEDPAPFEAERANLLATTVPRDDYWREVERKGTALKTQKAADQRSARVAADAAQISAALEQMRTAVSDAQRVNAQVEEQIAELDQRAEKLRGRQRELEAFLARTGPPDVGAKKP